MWALIRHPNPNAIGGHLWGLLGVHLQGTHQRYLALTHLAARGGGGRRGSMIGGVMIMRTTQGFSERQEG